MYQAVIVDDEPVIVSGIRDALDWEGFGFEIALATTSPATVLSFLSVHPVHLLITDISMPEMDGIALIREAKSLVPLLSVIVLSAYDNFDYVKGALRYGAENYLLKPLSSDELSDSIRNVVSHVKEREVLNMNYGGTMLTFRSTFVEQWLKNLLTPETLLERAGLLGINLEMDNYTAVIFSADNRDAASMSRFFDFLLSLLPGRFLAHFYFEMPYRLVCIFSGLDSSTEIRSFVLHLLALSESMGLPISASMGQTVPFYQSVCESYRQACSTLSAAAAGFPMSHRMIFSDRKPPKNWLNCWRPGIWMLSVPFIRIFMNSISPSAAPLPLPPACCQTYPQIWTNFRKNIPPLPGHCFLSPAGRKMRTATAPLLNVSYRNARQSKLPPANPCIPV